MGKAKNYSKMFDAENQDPIVEPTDAPDEVTEEPVAPKKNAKKIIIHIIS